MDTTKPAGGAPLDAPVRPHRTPARAEIEALMKRCQIGVGGRHALENAHSIMADCYGTLGALMLAVEQLAAECGRHADDLRCALEALDYCIEDSAELLNERSAQWGNYRKDRQATMAATLERHRAVADRLRRLLGGA